MALISLNDIGFVGASPLFSHLDLTVSKGDRVGLVAANGRGKSTLLRIIAGETAATHGEIATARGLRVGLAPQAAPEAVLDLTARDAVLAALDAEAAETESWRVDVALDDLDVPRDLRHVRMGALSGGWRRVVLLARTWVREPDVLLLDEPTNDLDLRRIGHLQTWLATVARGTPLVTASHDRAFLDAVTDRTLFLRPEASRLVPAPFGKARNALDETDAAEARRHDREMAKAGQLRRQAAKLRNVGVNSGSDLLLSKTKQLKDRAEKLEEAARPAHVERSAGTIRLSAATSHAKALVTIEDAAITDPAGRILFRAGPLWIGPGDRVVVLGPNGSGKSRLISAVAGALDAEGTGIRVAASVVAGVSDQTLSQLERFGSPLDAVTRGRDVGDRAARAMLAGAGTDIAFQDRPIAALSSGQRARLAMLLLRLDRPNLHVLDEPTNHLDIEGQEALERELVKEGGSAILVSHDRAFVRNVGTRFWLIEGGRLEEVDGPEPFFDAQLAPTGAPTGR